jgi:hypothetical protein
LQILSHYREHVKRFGSISQYSTNISELPHIRQIKEVYGVYNKIDAATQILDYEGRRLVLEIRMWNLKELLQIFKTGDRKKTPNERSIVEVGLPLGHLCNLSRGRVVSISQGTKGVVEVVVGTCDRCSEEL